MSDHKQDTILDIPIVADPDLPEDVAVMKRQKTCRCCFDRLIVGRMYLPDRPVYCPVCGGKRKSK